MKKYLWLSVCMVFTGMAAPAWAIETAAKQAILLDNTTGTVLYSKDADTLMHPSSMSKLMTLYVIFDHLKTGRAKLDDAFTVSEKAWRTQGSKTFVPLGQQMKLEELIHGIATQSGNDACIVAAEGISGSEEAFVAEMNATAQKLGMTHSKFANATGLPDDNHLMTARDLAILAQHIINDFPEYYPYFNLKEYTYNNITQQNRNRLLGNDIGVDGLKTGHTEDGGYGIVLSAKQGERRLILVINGLDSDDARTKEGDTLLRYGLREFTNKTLVRKGQTVDVADVWYGDKPQIPLVSNSDVVMTVPAGNNANVKLTLQYNGPIPAPVEQGAQVAELHIATEGGEERIVPLYAGEGANRLSGLARMGANFKHYILRQ